MFHIMTTDHSIVYLIMYEWISAISDICDIVWNTLSVFIGHGLDKLVYLTRIPMKL